MPARIRIAFVINSLAPAGAEGMLLRLVAGLPERFETLVVSLMDEGGLEAAFERAGARVEWLGLTGPGSVPGTVLRLARLLRDWRPDMVSTWLYHADLLGGAAARLAGIDAVAWNIRNGDLRPGRSTRTTRAVMRVCARLSRALPRTVLCCSHAARDVHVAQGYAADRFLVIPNGFDLSRFAPDPVARADLRAALGVPSGSPLIGMAGRWHPDKNHAGFLDAAARLRRTMPDARFLLAGQGVDAGNAGLAAQLRAHGLADAVSLMGHRADMHRVFAALDLAASASLTEAFPNTLGEAMACGVPCVATDVGDSAFIVGDTGRIVPPGDAAALAEAWRQLLALPPVERSALAVRARARVASEFSLEAIVTRYAAVFAEMASGGTGRAGRHAPATDGRL